MELSWSQNTLTVENYNLSQCEKQKIEYRTDKLIPDKTTWDRNFIPGAGPCGIIRFLQQYETDTGDYSKERHQLLDKFTVDDIMEEARKLRDGKSG